MKFSLKQRVNGLIVLALIGMFISFPFQGSFIGGLLFAAFTAATIGGLADSFAVSALFGQPLRIPWPRWMGTNIIACNRQRLINELVDMVEHELLSTDIIAAQLKQYNAAKVLANYAASPSGQLAIKQLVTKLISDLLKISNPAVLSLALNRLFEQGLRKTEPVKLAAKLLQWLIDSRYDAVIVKELSKQLKQFVEQAEVRQFVHEFIATALRSYERNKKGRQFVNSIAGLNADELTDKVMAFASKTLTELENGEHAWNEKLRKQLQQTAEDWEQPGEGAERWNERFRQAGQFLLQRVLTEQMVDKWRAELIAQLDADEQQGSSGRFKIWLEQRLEELLQRLAGQTELLQQLNQYVVSSLNAFIERNHRYIGKLVRDKLEQFDEQQLIQLVQDKADKDLQYIRLNGTLVGSLIGMLLYLLQALIGGLLS